MQIVGLARLGRDAELRYTQDGKLVAQLALAFNYGTKEADGNRPTQWIDASFWGERAEKLAEHLVKGQQLYICASDPHIEVFERKDGTRGEKLRARIDTIEFGARPANDDGKAPQRTQQQQRPAAPTNQSAKQPVQKPAADDFDDDIPFR